LRALDIIAEAIQRPVDPSPTRAAPNVMDERIRREGRRTLPNLSNGFRRLSPVGKEYA